jgi:hypothetical protein
MMGELRQSPTERARLRAAWEAHPKVRAFYTALTAHAKARGYKYDAAGMNAMCAYSTRWLSENGPLPKTGIVIG